MLIFLLSQSAIQNLGFRPYIKLINQRRILQVHTKFWDRSWTNPHVYSALSISRYSFMPLQTLLLYNILPAPRSCLWREAEARGGCSSSAPLDLVMFSVISGFLLPEFLRAHLQLLDRAPFFPLVFNGPSAATRYIIQAFWSTRGPLFSNGVAFSR